MFRKNILVSVYHLIKFSCIDRLTQKRGKRVLPRYWRSINHTSLKDIGEVGSYAYQVLFKKEERNHHFLYSD